MAINVEPLKQLYGEARAKDAVATAIARDTGISVDVPDAVKSTDLNRNVTTEDVLNKRSSMERGQAAQESATLDFNTALKALEEDPSNVQYASNYLFPTETELDKQYDAFNKQRRGFLSGAIEQAGDMLGIDSGKRLSRMEEERGIPDLRERVAESNERVAKLQGELIKIRPQIETEAGQTRVGAEARLTPVERNLRAEIASEALVQNALVGNLENSEKNVRQILELEFADAERNMNILMQQASLAAMQASTLEGELKQEAQNRSNQLQFLMAERASKLEQRQWNREASLNVLKVAASYGAPQNIITEVMRAPTVEDAIDAAGPYLQDPTVLLDMDYKRQLIAKTKKEIEQLGEEGVGMTPLELNAYAAQYASTGNVPTGLPKGTFGAVASVAKDLPKREGQVVDINTGVTSKNLQAAEQDDITRLTTIKKLLADLRVLDEQRPSGFWSGSLSAYGAVGNQGRLVQNAYLMKKKQVTDEIARMQTGAAMTVDEQTFYGDYLVGRVDLPGGKKSSQQIDTFEKFVVDRLDSVAASNNVAIIGHTKVKLPDGREVPAGAMIENENGSVGRVNADGSITIISI